MKKNIFDVGDDSASLTKLRPVSFVMKSDTSNRKKYGLIAEEVKEVYPELVVNDADGNAYTVQYHQLPTMILNEVQKNYQRITQLEQKIEQNDAQHAAIVAQLKQTIQDLVARIAALENRHQ